MRFEVYEGTDIPTNPKNSAASGLSPFMYLQSSYCKIKAEIADKSKELIALVLTSRGVSSTVLTA